MTAHSILCALIVLLSAAGLADSLYFTLVQYGRMRPDSRLVPAVCRMRESECRSLLDTHYARVFGFPNSLLGLPFYAFTALACALRWTTGSRALLPYALAASVAAFLLSAYLVDALIRRLHRRCPLCFLAQAINGALVVLLAILVAE
ncbi:MAG: vitamin K epoxide reductase family protein [Armatimonadota bacterium]|nr:vitamin K epoxide reductase family protein [Armatimonadota bacterium]